MMLQNQLKERLSQMRLKGLLQAYLKQQSDTTIKDLSFEERFGLSLISNDHRQNRPDWLLKESGMPAMPVLKMVDSAPGVTDRNQFNLYPLRMAYIIKIL